MKLSFQAEMEHGVMFLSDPYNRDIVPIDTGASSVTYTEDCVALWVPSYIDGEAKIVIGDIDDSSIYYDHKISIKCRSKIISLSNSNRFNYCLVELNTDNPLLRICAMGSSESGVICRYL